MNWILLAQTVPPAYAPWGPFEWGTAIGTAGALMLTALAAPLLAIYKQYQDNNAAVAVRQLQLEILRRQSTSLKENTDATVKGTDLVEGLQSDVRESIHQNNGMKTELMQVVREAAGASGELRVLRERGPDRTHARDRQTDKAGDTSELPAAADKVAEAADKLQPVIADAKEVVADGKSNVARVERLLDKGKNK